jgi:flagellar hook protein FlgE
MSIAQMGLDVTADDIANVGTTGYRPARVDAASLPAQAGATVIATPRSAQEPAAGMSGTDLAEELPAIAVAGATYAANAAAVRVQDETTGSLVDVLA